MHAIFHKILECASFMFDIAIFVTLVASRFNNSECVRVSRAEFKEREHTCSCLRILWSSLSTTCCHSRLTWVSRYRKAVRKYSLGFGLESSILVTPYVKGSGCMPISCRLSL